MIRGAGIIVAVYVDYPARNQVSFGYSRYLAAFPIDCFCVDTPLSAFGPGVELGQVLHGEVVRGAGLDMVFPSASFPAWAMIMHIGRIKQKRVAPPMRWGAKKQRNKDTQ